MKQDTLLLCLLALFSPISAAPIPRTLQECSQYASCRPFYHLITEARAQSQNPDSRASPVHSMVPVEEASSPVIEAASKQSHSLLIGLPSSQTLETEDHISAAHRRIGLKRVGNSFVSMSKNVASKCHKAAKSTNGFVYRRQGYTDFLVVSVVVLFLLAVVLVEIMDKLIQALGLFKPQGVILYEDDEPLPRYSPPAYDVPPPTCTCGRGKLELQ